MGNSSHLEGSKDLVNSSIIITDKAMLDEFGEHETNYKIHIDYELELVFVADEEFVNGYLQNGGIWGYNDSYEDAVRFFDTRNTIRL